MLRYYIIFRSRHKYEQNLLSSVYYFCQQLKLKQQISPKLFRLPSKNIILFYFNLPPHNITLIKTQPYYYFGA